MSKEQGSESAVSGSQYIKEEEMAEEKEASKKVSRRQFVKGAAVGGAGVAAAGVLASCAPAGTPVPAGTAAPCPTSPPAEQCAPCPTPWLPEKWDEEADIVVLGLGLAGSAAAIELDELGEDVLVLEKAPEALCGGQSRVSGQTMLSASDVERLMLYQRNLNDPNPVPEDVLRTWAEAITTQRDWISARAEEVGYEYLPTPMQLIEFPEIEGSDAIEGLGHIVDPDGASKTWEPFFLNVKNRQIKVLYETPGIELVQSPGAKEILGVVAEKSGERVYVKANKAVILCTGGFECNEQMLRDFYGTRTVYNLGSPFNTGDGIKMLLKAGADLWHMRSMTNTGGFWIGFKVPEYEPFFRNIMMPAWNWIEIARDGKRFYDEAFPWYAKHMHMYVHGELQDTPHAECLPTHLIFDETLRKAGQIATVWMSWAVKVQGYEWSEDNSAEVEKGWIVKADTISDLAAKIDRDPDLLEEVIERYNGFARNGEDLDFGRDPEKMAPIETPPYYAINIWPCLVATTGGGRRNKDAQVLDPDGNPIPRLYEAGELGETFGNVYQNGSFLTACIAFGRIAAKNAAAEEPWE